MIQLVQSILLFFFIKILFRNEKKNQAGSKDEGQFKHTFKIVINDKASSNKNENCKKVKNENNSTVSFRYIFHISRYWT